MAITTVAHQIVRVLREPERLKRLHYSKIFALAHQIWEKDDYAVLRSFFPLTPGDFKELEHQLLSDHDFRREIEDRFRNVRGIDISVFGDNGGKDYSPGCRLLYYFTFLQAPDTVVETGVLDGFSSSFFLKALEDNHKGSLCSIDLPATQAVNESSDKMNFSSLPSGMSPGWIVPDRYRERWDLRLGSSRELLPPLLSEHTSIDVFYHDSLHTSEYMSWEYEQALPKLKAGGLLLSDDVFWNRVFWSFTRRKGLAFEVARGKGFARKS